ncbi:alcohol dehydrogenase [Flagelloscypha sp. PMI_526]|nr:alcohol dehydrogenase [Flagelloscypha sp. PMI_526]
MASRSTIFRLIAASQHSACPCHGGHVASSLGQLSAANQLRHLATPVAASNLRFGDGVTQEVGMDLKNMKATKVGVFTDKNLARLPVVKTALESLESQGLQFHVYEDVVTEPTEASWRDAIDFSRQHDFSHFLALGGGSVMDTSKAANLFTVYREADLMDFINAPIGTRPSFICSQILDITSRSFKTGISSRYLKPVLGIVDVKNTETCPTELHVSSGLDVLFHRLAHFPLICALPRAAYQGSNPVADIFSEWALRTTINYLPRVAKDREDEEARRQMLLASSFAGIGFGNAGVHLCHGLSYPISGLNKKGPKYQHPGYQTDTPIIPHGVSVALTGPAVFQFTSPSSPSRHRHALALFAKTTASDPFIARIPDEEIGVYLYEAIAKFLDGLGSVPRGLKAIGYTTSDIPALVDGAIPQRRVLDLAPGLNEMDRREHLSSILERSMEY